mgnify:CR=1 FL=1
MSILDTIKESFNRVKSNYDHGFWADVGDEVGLWWHGLTMQDNEYINVMQGGVKDWWQSPVDRTFNPYKNDEGYEQYRHLWKDVRNESHFEFLKSNKLFNIFNF